MLPTSLITLTILTLQVVTSRGVVIGGDHECPSTWMNCGNGKCVAPYWICDGVNDCGNFKDEDDCSDPGKHIKCLSSQFQCQNKDCIPNRWHCDGEHDCADGSDEIECTNIDSTCDGFKCSDHHCIPHRWRCDNQMDCDDGSDEALCPQRTGQLCREDEFSCASGSCLPAGKVCNGIMECSDGSDEGAHCNDSCVNTTCSQGCKSTPSGASCFCHEGYALDSNNRTCSDIDECLDDGFCSHKCENHLGSFTCSCLEGYELKNRTCFAAGEEPILIFSTPKDIRGMYLHSGIYFPIYTSVSRSKTVDMDPIRERVYWTDLAAESMINSADLKGENFQTVINNGLLIPEDLQVDYIAQNIYITDSGLKQVLVCKLDGSMCYPLHKTNVDKPRSIALDIPEGLLYWSDWGVSPGIYRSGMDGSRRTVMVSSNIQWPNGIAVDHTTNRLYWSDAKLGRVEFITLDKKTRKVIFEEAVFHPYCLAVFEDRLYWSDWTTFSLESCNKFTGHEQHLVARENGIRIMGVHVYHPVLARKVANPCWMSLCSHMCVIAPLGKHTCLCQPGFVLLPDGTTCVIDSTSPQIFATEKSSVYHIQPEAVGKEVVKKLPLRRLESIGDVAYNWQDNVLYINDIKRRLILEVNLTTQANKELLSQHIDTIESLAYDWLGKNLYWVDAGKGTVEVLSLSTKARIILIEKLKRPIDIVLDPSKGLMFIAIMDGMNPHVDMYDMAGQLQKEVSLISGLVISLSLHPTEPLLFWADSRSHTISSVNYFNPANSKKVYVRHLPQVTSVTVGENFLYWMELSHSKINMMRLTNSSAIHSLVLPSKEREPAIRKIKYISGGHKDETHACIKNNGGCSHVCLLKPLGHTCSCPMGTTLSTDKATCTEEKECSAGEFKCVSNSHCVHSDYRCDEIPDCDDGSDEQNCEMKCPNGDFQCRNGRCIASSWKCDHRNDCGDGSDEENCDHEECPKNSFSCKNNQCLPTLWRCDGQKDCENGEDEEGCLNSTCKSDELRCDYGQCLPSSFACDGTDDCKDGSDESEKRCGSKVDTCSDGFQCGSGECIDLKMRCNHRGDCEDNSDETNCVQNTTSATACKKEMFQCDDGTCIYHHEVCDGYFDCDNDELGDCKKTECDQKEFLCAHSSRCIPANWLCDGDNDCGDGVDEKLNRCYHGQTTPKTTKSPKTVTTAPVCPEFVCGSKECLAWISVCNGIPECLDYSDEGRLCVTSCNQTNGGCAHLCRPSPSGPKCSCLVGYKLTDDGKTCEDENECEVSGLCSHFCNNTKGGFKCSCAEGYFLTRDHKTCKADGGTATLVYVLPDQVRGFEFNTRTQRVYFELEQTDMRGVDYDAHMGVLFWTEWKEGVVGRYNIGAKQNTIVTRNVNRPYYIKWDWITKNLYISTGEGKIFACSENGEFCAEILAVEWNHINSIEIAPLSRVLFWSIWSDVRQTGLGFIERANMDGSGNIVIISDKIYYPTSLTVDNVLEKIYWTDVKTNIIEVADYHGLNRRVIAREKVYYAFGLTVFEDYLYWADWGTDTFIRCNKFTGEEIVQLHKGDIKSEAIAVVHKAKQPKGTNYCLNSHCPQLCLPNPTGFTCHCDQKFEVSGASCMPKSSRPPVNATAFPVKQCEEDFCKNGGVCYVIDGAKRCRCPRTHYGFYCERSPKDASSRTAETPYDYSWVVAVFLSLASIAIIVLVIMICRQNRSKLGKWSDSLAVSFRNPRYLFRKKSGLVLDTDDGSGVDELMLGKKGAYTPSGFGNPLFNQRPYLDPAPEGDYKRWPSYDSDDSAFVSEHQTREDSSLTIDQTFNSMTNFSKDRIVQFFKRI